MISPLQELVSILSSSASRNEFWSISKMSGCMVRCGAGSKDYYSILGTGTLIEQEVDH